MLLLASALLTASSITILGYAPVGGSRAFASIAAALAAVGVVKVHGLVEGMCAHRVEVPGSCPVEIAPVSSPPGPDRG